jgi:hypothetical protein
MDSRDRGGRHRARLSDRPHQQQSPEAIVITDKRDQRDPTTLGKQILAMTGKTAHEKADKVLNVSDNGRKP